MNRRDFLRVSALAGGAVVFGVSFPGCAGPNRQIRETAEATGEFQPNLFLTFTPEDRILVAVEKSEMGQGIWTSHAMLVAEELRMDPERIEAYSADSHPELQTKFGLQLTGGSTSATESYIPIRKAAATAREMFLKAAADEWGVAPAECSCRGGGIHHPNGEGELRFGQLTQAAAGVEVPDDPPIRDAENFEVLGTPAKRNEGREKIDGSAEFGIDVEVPGMVCARCIRPPMFGATPASVDASDALEMEGVVDVVEFPFGVAVVAEKFWQARRAAQHVQVEWTDAKIDGLDTEQIHAAAAEAVAEPGRKQAGYGDVGVIDERDDLTVVNAEYSGPYLAHATMEPQNCTVEVRADGVEVWAPTQGPTLVQEAIARAVGVSRSDVEVHVTLLGGGFGRRAVPDVAVEAAKISEAVDRPVQLIWTREDDMRGGYYRPLNHNAVEAAIDDYGNLVAWRFHNVSQPLIPEVGETLSAVFPEWIPMAMRRLLTESVFGALHSGNLPEVAAIEGADPPYAVDNVRLEYTPIRTPVPVTFWRSVGHTYTAFAMECLVDELAEMTGEDPYDYRRRLLEDSPRLRRVLDRAARLGNWGEPLPEGYGRGIAAHPSFDTDVAEVVEAGVVDGRIDVRRVVCVVDCGIALNPDIVRAQMEGSIIMALSSAIGEKITLSGGRIDQGNYDEYRPMTMRETPEIEVEIIDSSEEPTGVGEPGVPPAIPALANAIYEAVGIRLRQMPFDDALARHLQED